MFTYLQSLPENARQRQQSLAEADNLIASAETLPKLALLFFVGILPFLISETLLLDWPTFLWWVKGQTPIWLGVVALLYFAVGLKLAPAQLTGASVEAMAQTSDDQELVPAPQTFETPYPFLSQTIESEERMVEAVTKLFWQQIRRRMPKLPQYPLLTRRFIPPASSHNSSA